MSERSFVDSATGGTLDYLIAAGKRNNRGQTTVFC